MIKCEVAANDDARNLPQGKSSSLEATLSNSGVDFSVYARNYTGLELLLFYRVDDHRPARVIHLDSRLDRTYHYWHIFVPGLRAGQLYAYCPVSSDAARQVLDRRKAVDLFTVLICVFSSVASQIFSIIASEITNFCNSERFYNIPQQLLWNAVVLVDSD